jgi:hypothetical protein
MSIHDVSSIKEEKTENAEYVALNVPNHHLKVSPPIDLISEVNQIHRLEKKIEGEDRTFLLMFATHPSKRSARKHLRETFTISQELIVKLNIINHTFSSIAFTETWLMTLNCDIHNIQGYWILPRWSYPPY